MAEINLIDSDSDGEVPVVAVAKVSPDVQQIMNMGFSKVQAELALKIKKNNMQEAINALMDGEVMVPQAPSPAKVHAKKRERPEEYTFESFSFEKTNYFAIMIAQFIS